MRYMLILIGLLGLDLAVPAQFSTAIAPRTFSFPADHGSHPQFKTEWWYLTGWLEAAPDQRYGYQLTFFRTAFGRDNGQPRPRTSSLAVSDLIIYHGALTDLNQRRFYTGQGLGRQASNWAGAATASLDVFLFADRLKALPNGRWQAVFTVDGHRLELELAAEKPPILHGQTPGLSLKGPDPGQASYYYSLPRLRTTGTLHLATGSSLAVQGQSWFDHEFGSNQLSQQQQGWDWFSVALDNGTDLMLYQLRRQDGRLEPASSGTLVTPAGQIHHLPLSTWQLTKQATWKSPHSQALYPAAWTIQVPDHQLELTVEPLLADQEHHTAATTQTTYWEGLCRFTGTYKQRPVTGLGYVELVGYAGAFGNRI